jgi:CRP-like cAMP-binding protein
MSSPEGDSGGRKDMGNAIWYLKRCDLFEHLRVEQVERLEKQAQTRTFRARAIIYAPGEPGTSVLVLARGRVKVKALTADGKESILAFIEEGEIFGELALFDTEPRNEYAEAVGVSQVLSLPKSEMLWLMEQQPDLALAVTKIVGLRRRRIENRLRNVLFCSSRERMLRLLLELAQAHGEHDTNRCAIRLPLSHQELAGLIGVSRETVTNILGQLQVEGLVRVERRRITILDLRRLQANTVKAA